jgi:hypothetical protein
MRCSRLTGCCAGIHHTSLLFNQWRPCSQHQIELHIEMKQLATDSWSGIFMSAASVAWGQGFGPCQTSATCTCPAARHPAPVGCRKPAVTSSVSTLRWEQRLATGCSNALGARTISLAHGVSTGIREVMCPAENLRLVQIAEGSDRRRIAPSCPGPASGCTSCDPAAQSS